MAQNVFVDHAIRSVSHTCTRAIYVTGIQNFEIHSYSPVEVSVPYQLGRVRWVLRAVAGVLRAVAGMPRSVLK